MTIIPSAQARALAGIHSTAHEASQREPLCEARIGPSTSPIRNASPMTAALDGSVGAVPPPESAPKDRTVLTWGITERSRLTLEPTGEQDAWWKVATRGGAGDPQVLLRFSLLVR
jgi:hypothetical protein